MQESTSHLTALVPCNGDQARVLGHFQLAFEQMPPVLLEASFRVSSLLTPEDLIPTSRGPRAEIKGRGSVFNPFNLDLHLLRLHIISQIQGSTAAAVSGSFAPVQLHCQAAPFQTGGRTSWACAKT